MGVTFTEYMNKSIYFGRGLTNFCISLGNEAQETRNTLHLLGLMDARSEIDVEYRTELFKWFNLKKGGTLKIRDLSLSVGVDYWKDLKNSNIIDTFDSFHCVLKNKSN